MAWQATVVPDRNHPTPADPGTAFQLGKIEGQLSELIHSQNNEALKNTARDEKLAKLSNVPDDIQAIKKEMAALKTDRDRRDGVYSFGGALTRSPLFVWIGMVALALWTWWKGHGQ